MQYFTEMNSYHNEKQSAVTLGKFDALHRGHQKLIEQVCKYADDQTVSIVCAFDMGKQALLTKNEKREQLKEKVDYLILCPFTKKIREMEAETFIQEILVNRFHASHLVVGTDFRFGHGKRGDARMLEQYAEQYGYQVDVIEKETLDGKIISSTYIRELLAEGNIVRANLLLGYTYQLSGTVRHGKQLGRTLGFPTMNVIPEEEKIMPKFGVYTCRIFVDGIWYNGIGNVGVKPTVTEEQKPLVEVYAFDFEGDAYGKEVTVEFCEFVRPEQKFSSIEELKAQVDEDINSGMGFFKTKGMYK